MVVADEQVPKIGLPILRAANRADREDFDSGLKIPKTGLYEVPGVGNTDRVKAKLPIGSFVINKRAVEALKEKKVILYL